MKNLLKETLELLERNGKGPPDVRWVGSTECGWFAWEKFAALADEEYDEGYGAAEVVRDILVVGDDWWLERGEYDGAEWWEFKTLPRRPPEQIEPGQIVGPPWKHRTLERAKK